jgi:hypothetical protein
MPGCGHEEAMVDCGPCAAWLAEQPAECDGRDFCSQDNGWLRRDLVEVFDDGYPRRLCPKCRRDRAHAIAREDRGDYEYDRMKDERTQREIP